MFRQSGVEMEATGLGDQQADKAKFEWFVRIQSYVDEFWIRVYKGTPSREGASVGSEKVVVLLTQTPERGSGSEVVLGNFAKTQNVEKSNMAQSKLQFVMNYINSDGVVATDITANFNVMTEEQIVNTQEAFANTLVGLGKANVAAQAAQPA